MTPIHLTRLEQSDDFLVPLGKNVWLMDNHRWALLVWEEQKTREQYTLIHADQHWDAGDDFNEFPELVPELLRADVARIRRYLVDDKLIRFDSFIAPAVRRGLFAEVHFFCTEEDGNDEGFHEEFRKETGVFQAVHHTAMALADAQFRHPVIFDLCLDLFDRSKYEGKGELWEQSEITAFLATVQHLVATAELVTVSLSFNYSGTHDDTRALASLVIPILLSYRCDA